jgi:hypothetical protein
VPESLIAFLESTDYESAVRNAVSLSAAMPTPWPASPVVSFRPSMAGGFVRGATDQYRAVEWRVSICPN